MTVLIASFAKLPHGEEVSAILHDLGVKSFPMQFCWYYDNVYRSSFETREKAEAWGKKEGLIQ